MKAGAVLEVEREPARLDDRIVVRVRCPHCGDEHLLGLRQVDGPQVCWCPRSARQYTASDPRAKKSKRLDKAA